VILTLSIHSPEYAVGDVRWSRNEEVVATRGCVAEWDYRRPAGGEAAEYALRERACIGVKNIDGWEGWATQRR